MISKIVSTILRLIAFVYLATLERVIGLPFLFLLFSFIWLDQNREKEYFYPMLLTLLSFILSSVYGFSWPLAFGVIWFLNYLLVPLAELMSNKQRRFLIVVLAGNLSLFLLLQLDISYMLLAQLTVSYLLVVVWMRVVNLDSKWRTRLKLE